MAKFVQRHDLADADAARAEAGLAAVLADSPDDTDAGGEAAVMGDVAVLVRDWDGGAR